MAVRKLKNSWWVDFQYSGKRYRKRSPVNSISGARAYEVRLRQKVLNGEPLEKIESKEKQQSFKKFAWKWHELYCKNNNEYSEIQEKYYILKTHLIPFFSDTPINGVSLGQIEQYKAKKIKAGLAKKTVNNHLTVLAKCLRTAEEWLELEKIPKIKKLKVPPQKFDFLTPEESELLLRHAKGPWYDMILIALKTGLRLGELQALDWSDINWESRILNVRYSLCKYRNIKKAPKSNKTRYIPLHDSIIEALGTKKQKSGYIFANSRTNPFDRKRMYMELEKACRQAGLRVITWHVMRHSFASHLVMAGAPMKAVQELLGHASIQTTMIYAHLSPRTLKSAIELLGPSLMDQEKCQPGVNQGQSRGKIFAPDDYIESDKTTKVKLKQTS